MNHPDPTPDALLVNGRITTLATGGDPSEATALAIRNGRVLAVGDEDEVRERLGSSAAVIDLEARRVIPGLIDSHVHFVRAGRSWNDEIHWEGHRSLADALAHVAEAANQRGPGAWTSVVGGWHWKQFREHRPPTLVELDAATPHNPFYLQMEFDSAQLNSVALRVLGLDESLEGTPDPAGFERDEHGVLTGVARGLPLVRWLASRVPEPGLHREVESTVALSRELARHGLTGCADGAGGAMGPEAYDAVFEAWRQDRLATRVRLYLNPTRGGTEPEDMAGYLRFLQPRFGDPMLAVTGLGEVFLFRTNDKIDSPADTSPETLAELAELFRACAARRWPIQIHAHQHRYLTAVLDMWDEVDQVHPIGDLRWSLVHAETLESSDLLRLSKLGAGVLAQSLFRFSGQRALDYWGPDQVRHSPPLRALLDAGVPVGLGSDGTRAASYRPFESIHWFLTGEMVDGTPTLRGENLLTREEALRGHTHHAAWFTFEEASRGRLVPGMWADLAVLSDDYFEVPVDEVPAITSELTLVGGRISWSSGALAADALPEIGDPLTAPSSQLATDRSS